MASSNLSVIQSSPRLCMFNLSCNYLLHVILRIIIRGELKLWVLFEYFQSYDFGSQFRTMNFPFSRQSLDMFKTYLTLPTVHPIALLFNFPCLRMHVGTYQINIHLCV